MGSAVVFLVFLAANLGQSTFRGVHPLDKRCKHLPEIAVQRRFSVIHYEQLVSAWNDYAERLLLIVRAFGDPAEDAVQEAFIQLSLQDSLPERVLPWLVSVARNQLISWRRSDVRRRRRESLVAQEWFQREANPSSGVNIEELSTELQKLQVREREIIVMYIWGEMTFEEIADQLDSSKSTVHRLYQSAMQELRCTLQASPSATQAPAGPRGEK